MASQVAQIYGVGLGYLSEDEVVKHSRGHARTNIGAHVRGLEVWKPTVNPVIQSDVATDGFEAISLDRSQVTSVSSTNTGEPSLPLAHQPTSVVDLRFHVSRF